MAQRLVPRVYRGYFEYLYARNEDPWDYETREYERAKYERTIDSLDGRRFRRALDVGCSIGVLTRMVAQRCDEVVAVDTSALAVQRARRRLSDFPEVSVHRSTLPEQMPDGQFDLILCSEVLYYWNRDLLLRAWDTFESALAPNGVLLIVHGRFQSHTCPVTGDEVHDLVTSHCALDHTFSETKPRYRLDRFEKQSLADSTSEGLTVPSTGCS
ncbi:class I SAM-dependent methyltransferase [Pseudonocardia acaciae]|uniref:class I SAM-dependent methyltransferase n=1 Tax=Pseudonocardia acaciae TaxID=551276 RepID=UPI0007E8E2A2|nr:SAM-dependent methyltransferase [Pseudonocardia acaciae]